MNNRKDGQSRGQVEDTESGGKDRGCTGSNVELFRCSDDSNQGLSDRIRLSLVLLL